MIKIIKGTYGRVIDGGVEAMTKGSAPFSLSEKREAELIALGVAEKVDEPVKASKYDGMKMPELREVAAAKGIENAHEVKSRKKLVAMIEDVEGKTTTDNEVDDDKALSGLLSED